MEKIWVNMVNPKTPCPWAHDWDNLIKRNRNKKGRKKIFQLIKLNVKRWN